MALSESSNKRLAKNTVFLYCRTLILLVIGVFTSRITLEVLGIDNYGIVNVVSGFVAMFTLVSGSLTTACQRFITFELGRERSNVHEVFNTSVIVHLVLSAFVVIIAETIGLYFVNQKLNLPETEFVAIQWVYQCSIISFVISLINIPYNAIIIAHEKMSVFAYISLLEGVLKLLIVIALLYINSNKLILYSILGLGTSIIVRLTFQFYCRKTFKNLVKVNLTFKPAMLKNIFGFAGWSFIGNTATILSNQGVNMILNIFCGVVVNAARGIAVMIENVVNNFVYNFTTALNPQITKSYAANDVIRFEKLIEMGMRYSFFLMIIIVIPLIIVCNDILHVWFTEVPEYTTLFVQLTLINALIITIGSPFLTALLATGKIRLYQIIAGGITLLNLPGSYLLLKFNFPPSSTYLLLITISFCSFLIRLIFVKSYSNIRMRKIAGSFLIKLLPVGLLSFLFSYLLSISIYHQDIFGLALFAIVSCLTTMVNIYVFGLGKDDQTKVNNFVCQRLHIHDR